VKKPAIINNFRNRVVGSGVEKTDQLQANAMNFRIHPDAQQQALSGAIDDIGFARSILVNKTTGNVIDGHARIALALRSGVEELPVEYVDLTEDEERKALLFIDPIAAMAASDKQKLDDLLQSVQSDDERVQQMIENLGIREGLIPPVDFDAEWQGMPEFEQEDNNGIFLNIRFINNEDRKKFFETIGYAFSENTKSIWYPERDMQQTARHKIQWEQEDD
jgi:hypothetical protein